VSFALDGLPLSSQGAQSCYTVFATFHCLPPWIRNTEAALLPTLIVPNVCVKKLFDKFMGISVWYSKPDTFPPCRCCRSRI
jgi:hypothetical protein